MADYPGLVDLDELDGSNGFTLIDTTPSARLGLDVANAGDVNGDGLDDTIITMRVTNSGPQFNYVVFGSTEPLPMDFDLSTLDGTNGFIIEAAAGTRQWFAQGVGDINGDGYADIAVGSSSDPVHDYEYEDLNVVFGGPDFEASLSLGALDGTNGFTLTTPDNSSRNWQFAGVGDTNGDGFDDVALGDRYSAQLLYGAADGFAPAAPLLDATVQPFSPNTSPFGAAAGGSLGDINGDGLADMAFGNDVLFGRADGYDPALTSEELDGSNGFRLVGEVGIRSVTSVGDVNGDGYDDFAVSAPGMPAHGHIRAGEVYVVFGTADGWDAELDLTALDGSNGFVVRGETLWQLGDDVAAAGDVNGDGFDDVVMTNVYGAAFVVFGQANYYGSSFDASEFDGTHGFIVDDDTPYGSIRNVAGGDMNGDGFADLALGLHRGGETGDTYGAAIVYGLAPSGPVTLVDGAADQTLRGGDFDDVIISYGGNDTLIGGGGDDSLRSVAGTDRLEGGLGDDEYFVFADHSDTIVDTGGIDTIRTTTHWDLADNPGIENVVLGAAGDWHVSGNGLDNHIVGSFGDNVLSGGLGNDRLEGKGGADVLIGGFGRDILIGGEGADRFDFVTTADSNAVGEGRDVIIDYAAGEILNLGKADANLSRGGNQAFDFIGEAEFTGVAGQLRYDTLTYTDGTVVTVVETDVTGDGEADFGFELRGVHALTAADFIL